MPERSTAKRTASESRRAARCGCVLLPRSCSRWSRNAVISSAPRSSIPTVPGSADHSHSEALRHLLTEIMAIRGQVTAGNGGRYRGRDGA